MGGMTIFLFFYRFFGTYFGGVFSAVQEPPFSPFGVSRGLPLGARPAPIVHLAIGKAYFPILSLFCLFFSDVEKTENGRNDPARLLPFRVPSGAPFNKSTEILVHF